MPTSHQIPHPSKTLWRWREIINGPSWYGCDTVVKMSFMSTPERPCTPKLVVSPSTMNYLEEKFPGWFTPPPAAKIFLSPQPGTSMICTSPKIVSPRPSADELLFVRHMELFGASPTPPMLSPLPKTPVREYTTKNIHQTSAPISIQPLPAVTPTLPALPFRRPEVPALPVVPLQGGNACSTTAKKRSRKRSKNRHRNRVSCLFVNGEKIPMRMVDIQNIRRAESSV